MDAWDGPTPLGRRSFRNVLARLPGTDSKPRILIAAHFDTKSLLASPEFAGANDSGSGVGLLLELLRVLAAAPDRTGPTLEFAFFDGEECQVDYGPSDGLHGSRRLAGHIAAEKRAAQYRAMILLDMIGDRNLGLALPADTPPALLRLLRAVAERRGTADRIGLRTTVMLDDHVPFQELGIPAIDLIDFDYGPGNSWWHTNEDTLDKLSAPSLQITGDLVLGLLSELRRGPLPAPDKDSVP